MIEHINIKHRSYCHYDDMIDLKDFGLKKFESRQQEVSFGIRSEIRTGLFYEKDNFKIKVDTDDDLPLNKTLKFPTLTIIDPQICLDECLCEL